MMSMIWVSLSVSDGVEEVMRRRAREASRVAVEVRRMLRR